MFASGVFMSEGLAGAQGVRVDGDSVARSEGSERFESVLSEEVLRGTRGKVRESAEERARGAAESFVALAFVQPVLKQLRETNMATAPFAPGAVEKQFGPLLDAELSRRITRASGFALVDRVAQDLLRHEARSDDRAEGAER